MGLRRWNYLCASRRAFADGAGPVARAGGAGLHAEPVFGAAGQAGDGAASMSEALVVTGHVPMPNWMIQSLGLARRFASRHLCAWALNSLFQCHLGRSLAGGVLKPYSVPVVPTNQSVGRTRIEPFFA